jgi:hypothetical protein
MYEDVLLSPIKIIDLERIIEKAARVAIEQVLREHVPIQKKNKNKEVQNLR